ncbi:MAG: conjugal transfer protein TraF [Pseudomonadota bacterium]
MLVRRAARGCVVLLALVLTVGAQSFGAQAQDTHPDTIYCNERKLGRYFYCDRMKRKLEEPPKIIEGVSSAPQTATEEVALIRDELEELRAEAVLRPTTESVSTYIRFQREQLDRAGLFSDVWRRTLWTDPSLDYNLQRPVSGASKRAWIDARKIDRRELMANLNERYGLFYFYAASCSACTEFSPILRGFADAYGVSVKAVSVDGGPSRHFPNAVIDQGEMAKLGLGGAPTPAVALFDTHTHKVTPVAFGVVAQSDLEERIFVLTQKMPGEDY